MNQNRKTDTTMSRKPKTKTVKELRKEIRKTLESAFFLRLSRKDKDDKDLKLFNTAAGLLFCQNPNPQAASFYWLAAISHHLRRLGYKYHEVLHIFYRAAENVQEYEQGCLVIYGVIEKLITDKLISHKLPKFLKDMRLFYYLIHVRNNQNIPPVRREIKYVLNELLDENLDTLTAAFLFLACIVCDKPGQAVRGEVAVYRSLRDKFFPIGLSYSAELFLHEMRLESGENSEMYNLVKAVIDKYGFIASTNQKELKDFIDINIAAGELLKLFHDKLRGKE